MREKQEMLVQSLGREDLLGREWQPTPLFLPGKSHRQRSLASCGVAESDMAEYPYLRLFLTN